LLEPSDYGIVDLFSTYATLLLPLCNWQMDMGLFRFMLDVRDDREKQIEMVSTVTNVNHIQTFLFLAFFVVVQFFFTSKYKIFLALEIVLNLYNATMMQTARGLGRNDIYSVASFFSASLTVAFNVLFIAVLKMGALGMFYGLIVAKILTDLYLLVALKYWKFYSIRKFNNAMLREITGYSLPLIPNQLAWWVVGASDRIVVSNILGVAQNGLYSVANKFSSMYITFYNIFNLAWTESCAVHINDEDGDKYLSDVITTMFSLFSAICIGIAACMPFAFPLLINVKYSEAYPQIPILLCAVLCQSVVGLVSVVYTAKKMSKVLAKTSFWIAVINLGTDLIMIKYIGLYAASLSTLFAYGVMMIYRCFDVRKYVNIVIPVSKLVKAFMLAAFVGVAYYSPSKILQATALVITVVYAVVENQSFLVGIAESVKHKIMKK
jgi:O-antigen/teichoic acid export membrane protein